MCVDKKCEMIELPKCVCDWKLKKCKSNKTSVNTDNNGYFGVILTSGFIVVVVGFCVILLVVVFKHKKHAQFNTLMLEGLNQYEFDPLYVNNTLVINNEEI